MCFPVLQLHSRICFEAAQLNKPKQQPKNPNTKPTKCFTVRKWDQSVVCACGHNCCEEQRNVGAFCWVWASVRQQQLSCPAQSWECAVAAVQALRHRGGSCWEQEELVGEGGEDKVLSLPWHSSAALLLCQVPPPRAAWRMVGPGEASHSFVWSPPVAAGGFHRKE